MKVSLKKTLSLMLALGLILPGATFLSHPLEAGAAETSKYADKLEVQPVKLPKGEKAKDYVSNPKQPDIYTLRSDFKVERNGEYDINYQPYVATVGAAATPEEKDKVNINIKFPDFPGYGKPQDNGNPLDQFLINYQKVVDAAKKGKSSGNTEYGITHQNSQDFKYDAKKKTINVRHVFQDISDFNKYGNKPGETDETKTTAEGSVGSNLKISPLPAKEIKGFVPETEFIQIQVPLNTAKFTVEYRYNRNHYDATFDTDGGTEVPTRTLYYQQVIPTLDTKDIPKKVGATFQGWKPSMELKDKSGKTFKAGEVIKDGNGDAIKDLNANLIMPSENIKFTAKWKDDPKADYAVQFWTEKADHPEKASLLDKYDFVGTHVYKSQDTGTRPNLANEPVKGVEFPDLDQKRLERIYRGEKFGGNQFLYINKFYKYNKELTDKENADPNNPSLVKSVSSNGKTVYNIYYDRQVYDLYFTKSNKQPESATFYPEIWRHGKQLGGPGDPYHFKARFNQLMREWPDDAQETKGFSEGKQSYGWGPNYAVPEWDSYYDTPPYRLSAKEFLDMTRYEERGGYTSEIDAGNGVTIPANQKANPQTFTTLSFGIAQRGGPGEDGQPMPHHMDFWMDGFKPGETIIDYDLYRTKADTSSLSYGHKYPVVQGFTPDKFSEISQQLTEDELDAVNEEREEITPFPNETIIDQYDFERTKGRMYFLPTFFNRADEFGDPNDGSEAFKKNGYIRFHYHRNKYKLRFNNDPAKLMDDSEYNKTNQTDIFFQQPLKDLNLDNPQTLLKLDLTDLVEKDDDGNYRIKRPKGLAPEMVFKGWALDPAGQKLVWENKETMPAHNLVLYAKWGEPDYKWKVTFDPNGGKLDPIAAEKVTTARKTIKEGDINDQKEVTYATKGTDEGDKQVFTLVQRQKLGAPQKPTRKGYSFMGWEVLRYTKDADGNYTEQADTSYRKTYGVPELYSFGNDVVAPIYLKAIWVKNDMQDVQVFHHFLDNNLAIDKTVKDNPAKETIENQRAGKYVAAIGSKQDANWILASDADLQNTKDKETKKFYDDYQKLADELGNRATKGNPYFQTLLVEAKKKSEDGTLVDNPNNEFHFFYRPFRSRHYQVNYVDERAKTELAKPGITAAERQKIIDKYRILDQEQVTSGARHYDARNYKPIIGWKLVSDPQQQLFYDVDEDTNQLKGTNARGTEGVDFFYKDNEINFFYKDVRVIEVPEGGKTPDGYVRVKFKASDGGSFGKDEKGNPIKEIDYDVLEGTKFKSIPVPRELKKGDAPEKGKYYITPEDGKTFEKWDQNLLLSQETIIKKRDDESPYVFTAMFDWFTLTTEGMAITEAFTDPANTWTNDFAPKLDVLKQLIKAKGKDDQIKPLPEYESIEFSDAAGNEVKTPADIYKLVSEKGKTDAEEQFLAITLKAKVIIKGEKNKREIDVPLKVYKNRYDALPSSGEMPDFLKTATSGNGDLVNLLKDTKAQNYVKVTVNPTNKLGNLTPKSYWVNPKAWVEIPEIAVSDEDKVSSRFKHWSADQETLNQDQTKDGVYDFSKRHKFSANAVIAPIFTPEEEPPAPSTPEPSVTPTKPEKPETPLPPAPSTPEPSVTPTEPETPETPLPPAPSAPEHPATPTKPEKTVPPAPATPQSKQIVSDSPVTGANGLLYLCAAALFTAAGSLVVIRRKRARK
ncbi:InlB B-repeat-containing protein [Varibaculum vaginae]|uniref:InlB B-repeat-containing protein n=1 Tax=Varibaculum vaginae TaxID=2364797 RepID=UPI000F08C4C0|nr:InlB B-repeat-containing protein [Varibaculum vaginae]